MQINRPTALLVCENCRSCKMCFVQQIHHVGTVYREFAGIDLQWRNNRVDMIVLVFVAPSIGGGGAVNKIMYYLY